MLLQLMFVAAVGAAYALGAALLFALLLLFMPLRRAIILAPVAVGSAVVGGGVSVFLMALFVDDTLDTQTEFLVYFGGIATLAICAALASAWAASKIAK
ncbi:MAG: hypothetical protein NW206_12790 [Hyphomonadaceae bacterium]|nr:hypothetical protein [Hyphomonadaceae bacterium]